MSKTDHNDANEDRLSRAFVEDVIQRTDLVELIKQEIEIVKRGKRYIGPCPFHEPREWTLAVCPERQVFYCFSCNKGGNAATFMMETKGSDFPQAIKELAERASG